MDTYPLRDEWNNPITDLDEEISDNEGAGVSSSNRRQEKDIPVATDPQDFLETIINENEYPWRSSFHKEAIRGSRSANPRSI
ncbi:6549_t:CDS:2 [Ambispora gerdemannii]|uniref:6549_t:CDS:1 n=1 Tax=Ambispora gerdemannii TaxID=144530 RepID=A0A9N9CZJ1_9GLOM|nr:6549_t:CDS:2 [Ambispora gerdemannii]